MQESRKTKVVKTGRFLKILSHGMDNLNVFFVVQAQRILYQNHSDLIHMNTLDNRYDTLKDKLVKNSSCSICLENFNSDEEIIRFNCSHDYHQCCCIFDLAKKHGQLWRDIYCSLWKRHALYEKDTFNLKISEIMKNFNLNELTFLIKHTTEVL